VNKVLVCRASVGTAARWRRIKVFFNSTSNSTDAAMAMMRNQSGPVPNMTCAGPQ